MKSLSTIIAGLQLQLDALYQLEGKDPPDSAIRTIAEAFCRMNDDQQAKFFVEAAAIMSRWPTARGNDQAWFIGKHLAECDCSTPEAREFIDNIHHRMHMGQTNIEGTVTLNLAGLGRCTGCGAVVVNAAFQTCGRGLVDICDKILTVRE